jgi:hypothetical protein
MRKNENLVLAALATLLLSGCVAAVVPLMLASAVVSVGGLAKVIQTSTGGSIEIAIDDTQLTPEQRAALKNINSLAVWPEKTGGAVTFAETLAEGGGFQVVTPSRVASALSKLQLSDDLRLMTAGEAREVFKKVCQETGADSLVSGKNTGGGTNMNIWSFDRANITHDFLVSIYGKSINGPIAEIPVKVKQLVGAKSASTEEISKLVNIEVAKKLVTLIKNPQKAQEQSQQSQYQVTGASSTQSEQAANHASTPEPVSAPMTTKEVQQRLLALGYQVGVPDGIMGKQTVAALMKFQQANNLAITGKADSDTMARLRQK